MTAVWTGSVRLIPGIPGPSKVLPVTPYLLMEGWYFCWQRGLGWELEWFIHGTREWPRWNLPDDETNERV